MNDEGQPKGRKPTGAWERARDEVAKRNDAARKAGRQQRAASEAEQDTTRRDAEREQMRRLSAKHRKEQ